MRTDVAIGLEPMFGMSTVVDDTENSGRIVESVTSMNDASGILFLNAEDTVGSTHMKIKMLIVASSGVLILNHIPFTGVVTKTVAVRALLTCNGELDAAVLHSLWARRKYS